MLLTSVYILATSNKEHDSALKARAKYSYIILPHTGRPAKCFLPSALVDVNIFHTGESDLIGEPTPTVHMKLLNITWSMEDSIQHPVCVVVFHEPEPVVPHRGADADCGDVHRVPLHHFLDDGARHHSVLASIPDTQHS